METKEIDWELAQKVVKEEQLDWYEDYDEAEGIFMGWIKKGSHKIVTYGEFLKWWDNR